MTEKRWAKNAKGEYVPETKNPPLRSKRSLEQTEMVIYDDSRYQVSLRANGMYTISQCDPSTKPRWYSEATGGNKYMMEIAQDYKLTRLVGILKG